MSMEEKNNLPVEEVHYTTFGERLREIRDEKGWSQTQLAQKLKTTKQMISCYELNQRSPRIELVQKYAKALNVPVDYLLGDTEAEAITKTFWTRKKKKKPSRRTQRSTLTTSLHRWQKALRILTSSSKPT